MRPKGMRFALLAAVLSGAAIVVLNGPCARAADLEIAARLDLPPGELAVTPDGRRFVSLHPAFHPNDPVAEITGPNTIRTFPVGGVHSVAAIRADRNGMLWMLDVGEPPRDGDGPRPVRLAAWSIATEKTACAIDLPASALEPDSAPCDLALDLEHHAAYIADPASGPDAALIVVDLNTLSARRVLQGAPCVVPENTDVSVNGQPAEIRKPDGSTTKLRTGVNALALDPAGEWLYFGPMNGASLYRAPVVKLLDRFAEPKALEAAVERYSPKPASGGLAIDASGRIYVADLAAGAVGAIGPDRQYTPLARDPGLLWPDSVVLGPDGAVYAVAAQLQASPEMNAGKADPKKPFLIFRLPPPAVAGSPGGVAK